MIIKIVNILLTAIKDAGFKLVYYTNENSFGLAEDYMECNPREKVCKTYKDIKVILNKIK